MAARKPTKAQMKRLINAIKSKSFALWQYGATGRTANIVSTKDIQAIESLTMKWMKRLG